MNEGRSLFPICQACHKPVWRLEGIHQDGRPKLVPCECRQEDDSGKVMTGERLQTLCREWQKTLRLQDWDVAVQVCRQRDMGAAASGRCIWVLPKKMAIIKVLDPIDWPGGPWPQDQEKTLVHELLHLHFAPFTADEGTAEDTAQEQAIDLLAGALVSLKRGARA